MVVVGKFTALFRLPAIIMLLLMVVVAQLLACGREDTRDQEISCDPGNPGDCTTNCTLMVNDSCDKRRFKEGRCVPNGDGDIVCICCAEAAGDNIRCLNIDTQRPPNDQDACVMLENVEILDNDVLLGSPCLS